MGHSSSVQPAASSRFPYFQDIAQALYETAALPMLVVDESGQILDANAAACQLAGGSMAALRAAALDELRLADGRSLATALTETPLGNGRKLLIAAAQPSPPPAAQELHAKADVLAHSPYGFDAVSADGKFIYANPAYLRLWGYASLDEILGTSPVGHCADPSVPEQIIRNLETHGEYTTQFTALRKDGSTFEVLMSAQKVVDEHGVVTYEGSSIDVTELLQGRRKLVLERKQARALLDAIPDLVWLKDDQGVYQACNPRFEALVGMPEAAVQGKTDFDFFPPEVAEAYRALDQEVMKTGQLNRNEEWATFASDGRTILAETIKTPIFDDAGQMLGVLGIARDITARHHAREALRQSEANLKAIFNHNLQGFVLLDPERRVLAMNSVAAELVEKQGKRPFQAGRHVEELFSSAQLHGFDDAFAQALQGQYSSHQVKIEAAGGSFWYEIHVSPVATDDGQITGASLSILDITSRKMVEIALQASEARLSGIIDSAMDAIVSLDEAQHIVMFNAAAQQMFGYTAEEAIGQPHDILLPERFHEVHHAHVFNFGQTGETNLNMGWQRSLVGRRANGEEFPVEVSISQVTVGEKVLYTAIMRDVTERAQAEAALRASEERFRVAVKNSNFIPAQFDKELRYQWIYNPHSDFNASLVLGQRDDELDDSESARQLMQLKQQVIETGEGVQAELTFSHSDGVQVYDFTIEPLRDLNGEIIGATSAAFNITQRKLAESALKAREEQLSLFIDHAPAALAMFDLEMRYLAVSRRWLADFALENVIGQSHYDLFPELPEWWKAVHRRAMAGEVVTADEDKFVRDDGHVQWLRWEVRPWYTTDDTVGGIVIFSEDISQRKNAEEAVKDLQGILSEAENVANIGSWRWDLQTQKVTWSAQMFALFGVDPATFDGDLDRIISTRIHPDDLAAVNQSNLSVLEERVPVPLEYRILLPDGTVRTVWAEGHFQYNEAGEPTALVGYVQDITERKNAEQALRQSEERFAKAFQLSPAALSLTRGDGRLVDVNQSYERLSGYTRAELIGHDATEFGIFTQAQRDDLRQRMMAQGGSLHEAEMVVRNRSGELRYVLYSVEGIEIGSEAYALTLAFDITDRKQLEITLKEMADNMATAQAMTHSGSWEIRLAPDGSFIEPHVWSDECYRIFGLEPGSMPITSAEFFSFIHPHDLPEVREVFMTGIAEQRETSWEYRLIRPDGTIRTVFDQVKPMVDERTGQVTKVVGLLQDITEGKRAAETIAQLNRQMELILNSAGEGIYGADVDGRITFINPTMANMLGWNSDELLGKDAHATFHHTRADGSPYPASECGIRHSLRLGRAFHNVEDTYWSRDGQPVLVDYTCTPIRDGGEILGSVMVVRDITEQKKVVEQQLLLEEQLRQAQKMESIGRLAGGVAHDFNNQLAVIKLYGDLMRYRMAKDDPLLPKLEQIRQAVERATHLTRQLLAFSRKQVLQPVVLDMNELITNLEKMLGRLIGEDIALSTDLQPGLWPITADPGQLEQAIMNLVINARDAMATGGMLTIETRNLIQDETTLALHQDALRGPVIMLAITDTGHGMDEETQRQIFEPFFTTKVSGKGTGLGLATVHGIVKQSGGTIYVYSEPGQGTTFKIYLPASEGLAPNLEDVTQTAVLQTGHETILLVEDEEALRDLVRLTLEEIGYTVLEAEDGVAALALAAEYPDVIHLLLTDVVLPHKGGRELAEALAAPRPQTRVLFMSGYMDDAVMRHGVLAAEMNFLSKPFSRSALASKVRDVLDKPKA